MTTVALIEESEACPEVAVIYREIRETLRIDFVPNMYKVMAHKPEFLQTQWRKTRAVMESGKLDKLTKEIIAVAVSAVMGCDY